MKCYNVIHKNKPPMYGIVIYTTNSGKAWWLYPNEEQRNICLNQINKSIKNNCLFTVNDQTGEIIND